MNFKTRFSGSIAILLFCTQSYAAEFIDDFNTDITNPRYRLQLDNITDPSVAFSKTAEGLGLNLVDAIPTDDDRTQISFQPVNFPNSIGITYSVISTDLSDSENGSVRMRIGLPLYNDSSDGGLGDESIDSRTGDVVAELTMSIFKDNTLSNFLLCLERRESDGGKTPAVEGLDNCQILEAKPELNTPYSVNLSLDRASNSMQFSINDETFAYDTPPDIFLPSTTTSEAVFQVRDGAASGNFQITELRTNSFSDNTFQLVGTDSPYRTDNFDSFDNDPSRSRVVENNVMTLIASNSEDSNNNEAFLRVAGINDFIAADITYSDESAVQVGDGISAVRLAGRLYNDTSDGDSSDNTGTVWGTTQLVVNSDGLLVGEYCLIRSNTSDFSDTIDLADGMDDGLCPRFDLPVVVDQSYSASMQLDRVNKKVIYKLNDETKEVQINSDMYDRDGFYKRAQVRITGGATGTIVGVFDNFTNSPTLAASSQIGSGGGSEANDSSSSGGGCSISRSGTDHGLLMLMLGSLIFLGYRVARRFSA